MIVLKGLLVGLEWPFNIIILEEGRNNTINETSVSVSLSTDAHRSLRYSIQQCQRSCKE